MIPNILGSITPEKKKTWINWDFFFTAQFGKYVPFSTFDAKQKKTIVLSVSWFGKRIHHLESPSPSQHASKIPQNQHRFWRPTHFGAPKWRQRMWWNDEVLNDSLCRPSKRVIFCWLYIIIFYHVLTQREHIDHFRQVQSQFPQSNHFRKVIIPTILASYSHDHHPFESNDNSPLIKKKHSN